MANSSNKQWRVYKPNNAGSGAASKVEYRVEYKDITKDGKTFKQRKPLLFWMSAPQTGKDANNNASFAWKDPKASVTLKLGETDIGEILAVLGGLKKQAGTDKGIFHKNASGNTSFTFKWDEEKGFYSIRIAAKREDGKVVAIQHTLTIGEGKILETLLKYAVERIYDWN